MEAREPSKEKVVWFAMSFMAKDSAQRWAEHMSSWLVFPFPTWEVFIKEFWLRFFEENEQDHALLKLEFPVVLHGLPGHLLVHRQLRGPCQFQRPTYEGHKVLDQSRPGNQPCHNQVE